MAYSSERKAAVLAKLLPPYNMTVIALAEQEGIASATLYKWRNQARIEGKPVPGSNKKITQWSAQARFATLVETATLNEAELSEYCRKKGLYPEQLLEWKQSFINHGENPNTADKTLLIQQTKEIKLLKKALNRKEKALAEAAALLVLRKKFNQYYGLEEAEED